MDRRAASLAIAIPLTVLDGYVAVYYGWPVWQAWSGDILGRGLLLVMAALAAVSLGNVWVPAIRRGGTALKTQPVAHGLPTVIAPDHSQGARHV